MNSFGLLLKKDLLEIVRTKKWLVYLIVFFSITILSVVSAWLLPELLNMLLVDTGFEEAFVYSASVGDSYIQFIANMGEIGWLLIAIMFSTSLVKEKISGTYYMLKSNGVSETKIVLSHFFSKLILISASYLFSLLLFIPLNLLIFKEYAGVRGVVALSYLYLSLVFALALGIFISSVVDKKSKGIVLVIAIYFILSILSMFPRIDIYNPLYGLILGNDIIMYSEYKLSDYLINLFVTIGFIIVGVIGSIFTFKNKINNRK